MPHFCCVVSLLPMCVLTKLAVLVRCPCCFSYASCSGRDMAASVLLGVVHPDPAGGAGEAYSVHPAMPAESVRPKGCSLQGSLAARPLMCSFQRSLPAACGPTLTVQEPPLPCLPAHQRAPDCAGRAPRRPRPEGAGRELAAACSAQQHLGPAVQPTPRCQT